MDDIMKVVINWIWLCIVCGVLGWIFKKVGKGVEEIPIQEKKEWKFSEYITYRFERRHTNPNNIRVSILLTGFDGLHENCIEDFKPFTLFKVDYCAPEGMSISIDAIYDFYCKLFQELKKNIPYEEIEENIRNGMVAPLVYGSSNFSLKLSDLVYDNRMEEFCINNYKKKKWFAIHRISDGSILRVFDDLGRKVDDYEVKEEPATHIIINLSKYIENSQ